MKKNIITFTIFFLCFFWFNEVSAESILEPQWSEFCPPLYENVVFIHTKANSKRNMENNYWALRKAKFDKSIAECKSMSKDSNELGICYSRVANLERNKNNQRKKAKIEKNMDLNMQIIDGKYWWY